LQWKKFASASPSPEVRHSPGPSADPAKAGNLRQASASKAMVNIDPSSIKLTSSFAAPKPDAAESF